MKLIASGTVTNASIESSHATVDQQILDDINLLAERLQWLCQRNRKRGQPSPRLRYLVVPREDAYACRVERLIEDPGDAHPADYNPRHGRWTPILVYGKGQTARAAIRDAASKLGLGARQWGWRTEPLNGWPDRYSSARNRPFRLLLRPGRY